MNNPYWKNICTIAEKQRSKGIQTYGCGIEENVKDIITRIDYLEEELVDALMYCEWIKDSIRVTGRWKGAGLGDYTCSLCWATFSGGDRFRFCPDCGHPMEVRE